MLRSFQFSRLPLIHFGKGKITLLPGLIKKQGNEIILVTGRRSFLGSPNASALFESFRKEGIKYQHVEITGEPSPEIIDSAVRMSRRNTYDYVVSIGGGSIIDAGKAISAMIKMEGSVSNYLEGVGFMEHSGLKVPFIAIPTTSGTGSEATKNAVISRIGKNGFKKSLRHDNFVPDIAIVDPELITSCPENITAASGMDCFTQLTESYLSDRSCEYTDALALEGLKAVRSSLIRSYRDMLDLDARSGMSFAALTSGICLANAGLGVVHGFASSIGGMFRIPHGVICATLMAPANAVTVRELRKRNQESSALKKYSLLGKLFINEQNKSDDFYIDGFIDYLNKITFEFKLQDLRQFGIREKDIPAICENTGIHNNPVKLMPDDLKEIILSRL
jgi:alcohol dehydrogenase class IV